LAILEPLIDGFYSNNHPVSIRLSMLLTIIGRENKNSAFLPILTQKSRRSRRVATNDFTDDPPWGNRD
jgi:hypothetical protein